MFPGGRNLRGEYLRCRRRVLRTEAPQHGHRIGTGLHYITSHIALGCRTSTGPSASTSACRPTYCCGFSQWRLLSCFLVGRITTLSTDVYTTQNLLSLRPAYLISNLETALNQHWAMCLRYFDALESVLIQARNLDERRHKLPRYPCLTACTPHAKVNVWSCAQSAHIQVLSAGIQHKTVIVVTALTYRRRTGL
jgi:hypothetical protein